QALSGKFAGGVERSLDRKGRVLGGWDDGRLAINGTRRGEGDGPDAVGAQRFEDVEGGEGVLLEVLPGVLQAEAHVGVGGKVKDGVATPHRCRQPVEVEVVAADEPETGMLLRARGKFRPARGEIVPA